MEETRVDALIENIEAQVKTLTFLVKELEAELSITGLQDEFARLGLVKDSGETDLPEPLTENGEDG
jgi:hypothetical protein